MSERSNCIMFSKSMIRFAYGVKPYLLQYPSTHPNPTAANEPISGNTKTKPPNAQTNPGGSGQYLVPLA